MRIRTFVTTLGFLSSHSKIRNRFFISNCSHESRLSITSLRDLGRCEYQERIPRIICSYHDDTEANDSAVIFLSWVDSREQFETFFSCDLRQCTSTRIKTSVPERNNLSTRLSSKLLFARNKFSDDEIQNRIESDVLNGMRPNQIEYKARTSERTDMVRIEGDYENEIIKCLRKITKKCWRQDPTARPKIGYVVSMLDRIIAGVHEKCRKSRPRRGK